MLPDDEPGTLNRQTALYKDVLKPEAERRRGQVGDLRGDGTLLEFEQVAYALEWSRLAHRAAAATGIGDMRPLALRVAIHQGTAFSTREGLFGDAVNIAAWLQQHGAPGTVISESVKEALSGGPGEPVLDLGRLRFMMRREPEFRPATFARRRQPFRQPETGEAYLEGLRAAGLPD